MSVWKHVYKNIYQVDDLNINEDFGNIYLNHRTHYILTRFICSSNLSIQSWRKKTFQLHSWNKTGQSTGFPLKLFSFIQFVFDLATQYTFKHICKTAVKVIIFMLSKNSIIIFVHTIIWMRKKYYSMTMARNGKKNSIEVALA